MKYDWNIEKNIWLKNIRGVTFEEIICLIEEGHLAAVLGHPRKPNQKIFVVNREGYAYNIPFTEDSDGKCFLKTVYPSRSSTKKYLGGKNEKDIT